jgi:MFS transporter, DHA2 family, multidrug resistance protein
VSAPPAAAELAAAPPITGTRNVLITLSVMLASIMQALDTTIANVALPHIQGSIAATQDQMAWVLTSYIVSAAVMTPLSGWLAGQFGRKRVFLYSVVGFTAASMFCGVAGSLPQIVVARILQGACGAALIPMSQAVLLDINPPERHARAMAIWVLGVAVGPILGPALGGWLTENYNWRWVFYINVPFGILAFIGIASFMPETQLRKLRFDFLGFCSLSIAVLGLQLTLDRGQLKDWFDSPEIWLEASAAALGFYIFLTHMLTTARPAFVSPTLFKDRNFLAGNMLIFIVGLVMFATLALLPALLQDLFNYSVLTTGLVTAPRGIGTFIAMFIMGRVGTRFDFRLVLVVGFALTALSLWQMTHFNLQMGESSVIWSGVAQGLGVGFVYVPIASATFATLAPALRNEGTAFFSLMRNIGSSIGISMVETLLTRNTQILHARLAEHVTMFNPLAREQMHGAPPSAHSLAALNAMVNRQAQMLAYNNDFKLMLLLTLITIPLVFVLRVKRRSAGPAVLIE